MTLWAQLAEPWKVAFEQAWIAYCSGSLPIGAALVDLEGRIVGRGRNRIFESLAELDDRCLHGHRLAHAELNALVSLDHSTINARQCVLYTTLEPCALCVGAIRMVGLKDVRCAARDAVAGSLALLEATEFMQRGGVRVQHLGDVELEAFSIAMNVAAHLWLVERLDLRPPVEGWDAAGLPGVELGRQLHASGELRRLAQDANTTIEQVLELLVTRYRLDSTPPVTTEGDAACQRRAARAESTTRPLVLIITGAPASGKTTVGRQLADALDLPYLSKDLFKETLFDSLSWNNRGWSRQLGGASVALLFRSAEALLQAGCSVALESNFYAGWDTSRFRALEERCSCRFVQVVCAAPGPILAERFERRARSGERHPGHTDADSLDELLPRLLAERWDALALEGPVFTVDTSDDMVDIETLARDIRALSVSHAPV